MHPDLISIGFLHIKTYGCCMALGFFMAWHVLSYLCRRIGRPFDPLGNLVISLMVSGVVGSRIAYVIEHWQSEFAANPMSVIRVDQGGLMFYGGFILAAAVFMGWCFFKKEKPCKPNKKYTDNIKEQKMLQAMTEKILAENNIILPQF